MNIILKEIVEKYFYGDSHIYNIIKYYTDKLYYNDVINEINILKNIILYKKCEKTYNKILKSNRKFLMINSFGSVDNFYSHVKNETYNIKKLHKSSLYSFIHISKIFFKKSTNLNKNGYTFHVPRIFYDPHFLKLEDYKKYYPTYSDESLEIILKNFTKRDINHFNFYQ